MSKAFTKDDGPPAPEVPRHRAPLPPGVPNYVTARGLAALRDELARLDARRPGDPAHAAWRAALEERVATAVVAPPPGDRREVRFGARVQVRDASGDLRRIQIVGVDEADPSAGRVAFVAPLARALLGRRLGDAVTARRPGGEDELEILGVEYDG